MQPKEILKKLREKNGYTIQDVSKKIGMSYTMCREYESGDRNIGMTAAIKFADFYSVTLDHIMGREPLPNPFEEMNLSPEAEKKVLETYNAFPAPARAFLLDVIRQLGNVMNDTPEAQQSSEDTA